MFAAPRDSRSRQHSASRSSDDQSSTRDRPRRFFQRYAHGLSISSQSLATSSFQYDDLPTPSAPTHTSRTTSAYSTPMTSPSTGYSSLLPGSLSSTTSESAPSPDSRHQSEFGLLTPGASSPCSPVHGSASSSSSYPVSPQPRSVTKSNSQASAPSVPRGYPSGSLSHIPSTSFHSPPTSPTTSSIDNNSPVEHHTRSHSSRLTVSIKNFLSRPALPSPSRLSFNSSATTPSESDASPRSFHVLASASRWPLTPRKSRPPDLEISGNVAPAMSNPGRTCNAQIDVHRRYASEAVGKICNAGTACGPPTSQESLDAPLRNVPLATARAREPRTRNVLRRRPSGSAKLFKGRERGLSSPSCLHQGDADHIRPPPKEGTSRQGGTPYPLTAAGAVVEAYKQHEFHCDDTPSLSKLSIEDSISSSAPHVGMYDQDQPDHSPTPYYTIFGSSSERVIQAGDPEDRWSGFEADQCVWASSRATSPPQPPVSDSGGRSLTRKASSRWRKAKERRRTSEESPLRDRDNPKGRPSCQEMVGGDKSSARSAGRSMDCVPNSADGAWASPSAGHVRSGSEKADSNEGPGKLWRLMRRISTGGLRDRFHIDKTVPPVPTIPKELLDKANLGERGNTPLSLPRHHPSPSSRGKGPVRPSTAPQSITTAPPSAAIVASSHNSSDVTSAQLFRRTHSARSSVSSYGEVVIVSRMSEVVLEQRIITPREQLRLADGHADSGEPGTSSVLVPRSPRRSSSVPVGLKKAEDGDDAARVPLPSPCRQTCFGETPSSGSSRPSSMAASASGSARGSYQDRGLDPGGSRMEDGTVALSPPPRPPKNSRRGGRGSGASSSSHSMANRQVECGGGSGGVRQMDRMPSAQSDMTARYESPEPGRSRGLGEEDDRDVSPDDTTTQLTFRELDGPRQPPLSEQEKADIWDKLLARSERAGGTLHINGAAALMSDSMSMRFSTHSEV